MTNVSAAALLADIETRLKAAAAVTALLGAGERVHLGRIANLPERLLPAVCLYRPEERGEPKSGGHPLYEVEFTFAIEVRVAEKDSWDVAVGAITDAIKAALFKDGGWTKRWSEPVGYSIRQFRARPDESDVPFVGEVLTVVGRLADWHEYPPTGPDLLKVHLDVKAPDAPEGDSLAKADHVAEGYEDPE